MGPENGYAEARREKDVPNKFARRRTTELS